MRAGVPRLYALALTTLRGSLLSQLNDVEHGDTATTIVLAQPSTVASTSAAATTPESTTAPPPTCTTTSPSPVPTSIPSTQHIHASYVDPEASEEEFYRPSINARKREPQSPTFTLYNPTFEPLLAGTTSHSSPRSFTSLLDNISSLPSHRSHQHLPEVSPSLDTLSQSHSQSISELSESTSFESVLSTLCLSPDPFILPSTHNDNEAEKVVPTPHVPAAAVPRIELPVLAAAGSSPRTRARLRDPGSLLDVEFFSQTDHFLTHSSSVPSVNDAFSNIAQAQQLTTSPFIMEPSPVPVLLPPLQVSHIDNACSSSYNCDAVRCSTAQHCASMHSHIDAIPIHAARSTNTLQGNLHAGLPEICESLPEHLHAARGISNDDVHEHNAMHGSTLYSELMHDRHASEVGAAQQDSAQPSAGLLRRLSGASGAVSSHFHHTPVLRPSAQLTARRHTHHTGGPGSHLTYSELDEEEQRTNGAASQSALSRAISAVDGGSCIAPGPSPGAATAPPQHRRTHDGSRRGLPRSGALSALCDRSFAFPANTNDISSPPRTGSVSAPGGIVTASGATPSDSTMNWYGTVASGDLDRTSTVAAGYSSNSAAFLPSHRGSRSGFASFTQNIRRSLKTFGGISRSRVSFCGEAGDNSMLSDDESEVLCPICMDAEVAVSVQACSHCLCVDCARRLCVSAVKPVECPMCRTRVDRFVKADGLQR